MQFRILIWAAIMLIAGCASAAPTVAGSSSIRFDIQGKTYDEVWSTIERVAGQSLTIVDRNRDAGSLKATKGVLMGPWGDVVEFFVRPAHNGAPEYSVKLESESRPGSHLPDKDWVHTVADRIKSELGQ